LCTLHQFAPWGNVQIGDELPYVPRHQVSASVETDHQAWRARLDGFYVGRMRTVAGQGAYVASSSTDSYVVLNVSGEYELTSGASLFASVQNLADNSYIVGRHPAGVRPGLRASCRPVSRLRLAGEGYVREAFASSGADIAGRVPRVQSARTHRPAPQRIATKPGGRRQQCVVPTVTLL
jgi:TonB dependent receptor-like, beta-barrel